MRTSVTCFGPWAGNMDNRGDCDPKFFGQLHESCIGSAISQFSPNSKPWPIQSWPVWIVDSGLIPFKEHYLLMFFKIYFNHGIPAWKKTICSGHLKQTHMLMFFKNCLEMLWIWHSWLIWHPVCHHGYPFLLIQMVSVPIIFVTPVFTCTVERGSGLSNPLTGMIKKTNTISFITWKLKQIYLISPTGMVRTHSAGNIHGEG